MRLKSSKIQLKKEVNGRLARHARANSAAGGHPQLGAASCYSTPQQYGRTTAFRPGSTLGRTRALMSDLKKIKVKESSKSPFESLRNRTNDIGS